MFNFDFDLEELEDDLVISGAEGQNQHSTSGLQSQDRGAVGAYEAAETSRAGEARYRKMSLEAMIDLLPPSISYSPLTLPFLGPSSHISDPIVEDDTESESGYTQIPPNSILRRDLFDARFQLMNEDDDEHNDNRQDGADEKDNQQYVDSDTDLIPGTYEGGLKTWEGGVDLVQVLNEMDQRIDGGITKGLKGKKVLELGCGTALPTLYLLRRLIDSPRQSPSSASSSPVPKTVFHLQDYNLSVLHLVTLPNILLSVLPCSSRDDDSLTLDITQETVQEFMDILERANIEIEFSYGDWKGMAEEVKAEWDLVLTAETIYREESVESLISCLKQAAAPSHADDAAVEPGAETGSKVVEVEGQVDAVKTVDNEDQDQDNNDVTPWKEGEQVTLVAAKVLYFGVGGGLSDFTNRVERRNGSVSDVKSWSQGVGRKVVRLTW